LKADRYFGEAQILKKKKGQLKQHCPAAEIRGWGLVVRTAGPKMVLIPQ